MPVDLQWHADDPVLITTYSGSLSAKEYYAMCQKRLSLIEDGPQQLILLADVHSLETFRDADKVEVGENVLLHDKVCCTFIVLPEDFYHRLTQSMIGDHPLVQYFPDLDSALTSAEALAARLN